MRIRGARAGLPRWSYGADRGGERRRAADRRADRPQPRPSAPGGAARREPARRAGPHRLCGQSGAQTRLADRSDRSRPCPEGGRPCPRAGGDESGAGPDRQQGLWRRRRPAQRDPLRDRNLSEGRQRMSDDARALADPGRLSAWLDAYIPALGGGPLAVEKIHGGTSNVILSLNRGAQTLILRRPPAVPPPGSAKSVLREARVLTALNGTDVPHPACHGRRADHGETGP